MLTPILAAVTARLITRLNSLCLFLCSLVAIGVVLSRNVEDAADELGYDPVVAHQVISRVRVVAEHPGIETLATFLWVVGLSCLVVSGAQSWDTKAGGSAVLGFAVLVFTDSAAAHLWVWALFAIALIVRARRSDTYEAGFAVLSLAMAVAYAGFVVMGAFFGSTRPTPDPPVTR